MQYISLSEIETELKISRQSIRNWEKKGLLVAKKMANEIRCFARKDVLALHEAYVLKTRKPRRFEVFQSPRTTFKAIELFSGAGGLALGFHNAGLNTEMLVEIDKDSANTLKRNHPEWNVLHNDIRNIDFQKYRGAIDVVAGGFPCQAFSYAGKGLGFKDTRGTLFFEFARCLQEVMPKIAIGENVRGLLNHDKGRTLQTMLNSLDEIGYVPYFKILQAQFFDVPQKRERLVIIAIRKDLAVKPVFPENRDYFLTLRDTIQDCPQAAFTPYSAKKRKYLELIPEGGYWRDLPIDLRKEYMGVSFYRGGGKTGMARRLAWDEPSLTLTCNPSQKHTERCHPKETRPLNVREYARIQTFPDTWEFTGSVSSKYRQIGNAVPVNLGYHIGRAVVAMLENCAN